MRRLTQARIDILEAEVQRRSSGGSLEDLISRLPQILADPGPRGNPASSRLPLQMAPEQDSEWAPELERFDGVLANLPTLTDDRAAGGDRRPAIARARGLRSTPRAVRGHRPHRPHAGRAAPLTSSSHGSLKCPSRGAGRIVAAMQRVAMLSVHTSPLAQPGAGDGGGMNVYVRALASALARAGVAVDVLTRAEHAEQPTVRRGRARLPRAARRRRAARAGAAARAARPRRRSSSTRRATCSTPRRRPRRAARELLAVGCGRPPAQARARPAAGRDVPHARARQGRGGSRRRRSRCARASSTRSSRAPTSCSRRRARSTTSSCATTAPTPSASRSSRPASTTPCSRPATARAARRRARARRRPGAAVRRAHPAAEGRRPRGACLAELDDRDAHAGRRRRPERTRRRGRAGSALHALVDELGLEHRVRFVAAAAARRARRLLPRRRRVHRAVAHRVVRSRRARSGRVRHAGRRRRVGGLRSLVDDGATGFLVDEPRPRRLRRADRPTCCDDELRRDGRAARTRGPTRYRWSITAARLRRLYGDLVARGSCAASSATRRPRLASRQAARTLVAAHLEGPVAAEPWVQTVEYDPELPRWYVRFGCDGRDAATIYFDLHQRTLRYEVYFLPDPARAPRRALPVPAPAQPHDVRRALLDRSRRRRVSRRSRRARAPRRRRARPHHRRALRARRAVVPARRAASPSGARHES